MYKFESLTSDTISNNDFSRIVKFIESEQNINLAFINMGWNNPAGLLYNIHNKLRWCTNFGRIYIASLDNRIVGISCIELADSLSKWAIGGVRTWIAKEYRGTHLPSAMLSQQVKWAREVGCNFLLLTFNEYNKAAYNAVAAGSKYRIAAGWSVWWDDCIAVPDPILIRCTRQWAIIKPVLCADPATNLLELVIWATQHNK